MELNHLILCSGTMRRRGWKTLDANPKFEPDFCAYIPPLPAAVKAIKWDEIEWIHGITSFYPWDAKTILSELHDVLAPGGKLVMEQPNFTKVIGARTVILDHLFGDPESQNPLHMNKWAYSPASLTIQLHMAGFTQVDILPAKYHIPERDFRVEAYR